MTNALKEAAKAKERKLKKTPVRLSNRTMSLYDRFQESFGLPPNLPESGRELQEELSMSDAYDSERLLTDVNASYEDWEEMADQEIDDDTSQRSLIAFDKRKARAKKLHRELMSQLRLDSKWKRTSGYVVEL